MGSRIAVVAAVESTIVPTRRLIESVAARRGVTVDISVVVSEGAWERFESGDVDGYLKAVADTCTALDGSADVIVLAQSSMAGAESLATTTTPILSSPRLAVEDAAAALAR